MTDKKQTTVVIVAEVDPEAEEIEIHVQPCEGGYHAPKVHDFGSSSGRTVKKSAWDKSDNSHEGIRRPGARLKKGLPPGPSKRDILNAKDSELQQEKLDRRKILEKTMAKADVEIQLKTEFEERERQLECEWDDLLGF
ncbi:uncharacterized protein K460DRAFT_390968 [Cucurbitaria berberidis CBS 394.84]|uniref:Uncharacterized protein n=1 Tax=Cucurbitaria berberidis CBS 394.84 TaxID=1168544 RepID=A0A9P4GSX2_9PLEO|nr:uncharacterized protein K460DRAFT_390968 [Cucurbitaria berberidis CBS 394.84]KAF1850466.1 hypothetical protein K460DRAFT_390968 [Cucurbitaria berberidis CBS 394.84]